MPSEPSEGIIAPGALRPAPVTHREFSRQGRKSSHPRKTRGIAAQLEKAKVVRNTLGARPWHGKKPTDEQRFKQSASRVRAGLSDLNRPHALRDVLDSLRGCRSQRLNGRISPGPAPIFRPELQPRFQRGNATGGGQSEAQEFFAPRKIEVIDDIDEQEPRL